MGPVDVGSGSGDLQVDDAGAGDVKARTGSGNIRVNGFNGGFTGKTGSGDIEAFGHLQDGGMISTGSGDVRLHLTPDSRFTLEACDGIGRYSREDGRRRRGEHRHFAASRHDRG